MLLFEFYICNTRMRGYMKKYAIRSLVIVIISPIDATIVQNHASIPIYINSFTLKINNGLDTTIFIEKIGTFIQPDQTIRIEDLIMQYPVIISALDLTVGNNRYHLTITPHPYEGTITIQEDGTLAYSSNIALSQPVEEVIRHPNHSYGPFML